MSNWVYDAQFLKDLNDRYIVKTSKVRQFLSKTSHQKLILAASKGMGKTLLMKYKRKSLEEAQEKSGSVLIPSGHASDYVIMPINLNFQVLNELKKYQFWDGLWQISIAISCILNTKQKFDEYEKEITIKKIVDTDLPKEIKEQLSKAIKSEKYQPKDSPSDILQKILSQDLRTINSIRSQTLQTILGLYRTSISSSCYVFIDSLDHALTSSYPDDLEIWKSAQCGLIKAAWDLSRHNTHVKIFTTIRQEAYAAFDDAEKANIKGSVLVLDYTKKDLEKIFLSSIIEFTNCNSIDEFIQVDSVRNRFLGVKEKSFDYIFRHTIQTPRSFILIGDKLDDIRETLKDNDEKQKGLLTKPEDIKSRNRLIINVVNSSSSEIGIDYLKTEKKLFFKKKDPDKFLEALAMNVRSNIISGNQIQHISETIQESHGYEHPFCLLYNLGLLGVLAYKAGTNTKLQTFKKPHEFDWNYIDLISLKDSKGVYFIHPCLHQYFMDKNDQFRYYKIKVGDELQWGKKQEKALEKQTLRVFISYSRKDSKIVTDIASKIKNIFSAQGVLNDIWFDEWKLISGRWVSDQMQEGLSESDYLVLALSSNSLASNAVSIEWKTKLQDKLDMGEDTVLPFLLDDMDREHIPPFLKPIYTYRYNDNNKNIIRLARDILFLRDEGLSYR